jgi:hypothetical protein
VTGGYRGPRPLLPSPLHNQPKDTEPKIIFFTRVCSDAGVYRVGGEKEAPSEMEGNGGVVPKPQQLQQALKQRLQHHTRPTRRLYATPALSLSVSPVYKRQGLQHLQQNAPPIQLMRRLGPSPPAPHFCGSDLVATSRCTATLQQPLQLTVAATTCPADTPPTRALSLATAAR